MLDKLDRLYAIEMVLAKLWFELFCRFPMVEDTEHYFLQGMHWANGAANTFKIMGEVADMFTAIKKELSEEEYAEFLLRMEQNDSLFN